MNQQCKVCGEPAAGFHFGAFTCEGCKSFFGRTYNNLSSISECKNNGECVINKKNRTSCKACRLRKCLLVGMSKSGSRYGRRSNWFKIHCLLQEQQQNKANNNSGGNNNTSSNSSNASTNNNQGMLQNDFISSHFLANLYSNYGQNNNNNNVSTHNNNTIKGQDGRDWKEIKRVSSPSDSGASSADPEESFIKFSNHLTKPRSSSITEKSKPDKKLTLDQLEPLNGRTSITNLIKPISPFIPYMQHLTTRPPPASSDYFMLPLSLPQISITPNPVAVAPKISFAENEQHEPMDLSFKAIKRRKELDERDVTSIEVKLRRDASPNLSPVVDGPRPIPLDLTFVRMPLSG